ncbi:hypothetical protein I79_013990 [Cricetulus griseus]|uniref:Uncharacterized protein n=1 Tax=Cricetulus griseus TaxID=10029 RepID=G3HSZ0_CRIGR|nr:hypothetical protein I79_013990 [Cricetulus griseus]
MEQYTLYYAGCCPQVVGFSSRKVPFETSDKPCPANPFLSLRCLPGIKKKRLIRKSWNLHLQTVTIWPFYVHIRVGS